MNGIAGIDWGCFSWMLSKTNSLDLFMVLESEYFIDTQGEICSSWTELTAAYIKQPWIAVEHFYSPLLIWLYFIIFWILSYFPLSLLNFFPPLVSAVSPVIAISPTVLNVIEDQQVTLPCVLLAGNPLPERQWLHNYGLVRTHEKFTFRSVSHVFFAI